jgi:hypothetical protein
VKSVNSLKMQVMDYLCSGGYRPASAAQQTALSRVKTYRHSSGEIEWRRAPRCDFSGFDLMENSGCMLVRFMGPLPQEPKALEGYIRVLENCGFAIQPDADPERDGRTAIRVLPKS